MTNELKINRWTKNGYDRLYIDSPLINFGQKFWIEIENGEHHRPSWMKCDWVLKSSATDMAGRGSLEKTGELLIKQIEEMIGADYISITFEQIAEVA